MNPSQYFSNAGQLFKSLLKGEFKEQTQGNFFYSKTDVGICLAHSILGLPVVITQWNPNFKKKVYFCGLPLFTKVRKPLSVEHGEQYQIDNGRKPRVYIHIGGLPFFDNRSGIPRVAKKLVEEGMKNPNVDVLPVYPDPRDGTYKVALAWIKEMGYEGFCRTDVNDIVTDPTITIGKGDWLVHTMINPFELDFEHIKLEEMRNLGMKVGFLCHDIIAERNPEYFKKRDARNFSRWLRMIDKYDGIFAISKTTMLDYLQWRDEQKLGKSECPIKWFHLGSDFKKTIGTLNDADQGLMSKIQKQDYYLQVSTIEPRKGYGQLLEAFDCLWNKGSELAVVFVGRQGWKVKGLCRQIKNHPQFNKKLFWLSGVGDEFLTSLYSNSKGVIVASENEGFGLSVVEATFYGKPLLVRDIPVFREVASGNATYFSAITGKGLAESIESFDSSISDFSSSEKSYKTIQMMSWSESFESFYQLL